jgi:hypothetical protein
MAYEMTKLSVTSEMPNEVNLAYPFCTVASVSRMSLALIFDDEVRVAWITHGNLELPR